MKKGPTYKKSQKDLEEDLQNQVEALKALCALYDSGTIVIYQQISTIIRSLIHDGQKPALLAALKLRKEIMFFDSCGEINPKNLVTENRLCLMRISSEGAKYLPKLNNGPPEKTKHLQFSKWWNAQVVKDKSHNLISRRDIVLSVANTDGGAHVDVEIDEIYKNLSKDNSLNWTSSLDGVSAPLGNPVPACIRQIAYELLDTLKKYQK